MAEWDEIKKLAADFQRLQESDTLQKISERNCIDIIKKLSELNLIDLIYTTDGREFVTPSQLSREIQDEISVNGGKMHLHDLAATINVDYHHIENKSKDLVRDYPDEYFLVLGQIIHATYKDSLAKEINEQLQCNGQITIAELSKTIDLPADFIYAIVTERLGTIIDGIVASHDPRTFYTSDFIARYRSKISGALSGVSCPTTIATLLRRFPEIPERIFLPVTEALIKEGRIDATIESRLFIPAIYAREQNEWIDNFYKQNSYIEYDVLSRMDIKQPKAFLRKKFNNCVFLKTCCVSHLISAQVESVIEECIASNGWMDLKSVLPSILDKDDIELLVQDVFKSNKSFEASCLIINKVNVCSTGFLATCKSSFDSVMKTKANDHLKEGRLMSYFIGGSAVDDTNSNLKSKPINNKLDDVDNTWDDEPQGRGSKKDRRKNKANKEAAANSQKQPEKMQDTSTKQRSKQEASVQIDLTSQESVSSQAPADENVSETVRNEQRNVPQTEKEDVKEDVSKDETKPTKKSVKVIEETILDDEPQGKGSKASKAANKRSGGGGGGTQGREVRTKNVKKKYIPGNKHNQSKNDDDSDNDSTNIKSSNKGRRGRTSKRSVSPDRGQSKQSEHLKEPLTFMTVDEISDQLSTSIEDARDCEPDFLDSIASIIEHDLNSTYLNIAHEIFNESFKEHDDQLDNDNGSDEIEVIS